MRLRKEVMNEKVTVLRGQSGTSQDIFVHQLVVGDIVLLAQGDRRAARGEQRLGLAEGEPIPRAERLGGRRPRRPRRRNRNSNLPMSPRNTSRRARVTP